MQHCQNVDGNKHEVTKPDGTKLRVTMMGDVQLSDNIILKNVLFVPKLHFNLISIQKLCHDSDIVLTFLSFDCWFQDHSKKKVSHLGKLKKGLYYTQDKRPYEDLHKESPTPKDSLLYLTTSLDMINEISCFTCVMVIYPSKD